jgi:hypothetical protein
VIEVEPSPRPTEISFTVRGDPVSQNRAWRIITFKPKGGGEPHASLKLSKQGGEYKYRVGSVVELVRPPEWDRQNEYIVDAVYFFDSRRPDVDGPGKLLLDALSDFELDVRSRKTHFTGLFPNDRRVWRFTQQKELDPENPRTEITVRLRHPWRPVQRELLR